MSSAVDKSKNRHRAAHIDLWAAVLTPQAEYNYSDFKELSYSDDCTHRLSTESREEIQWKISGNGKTYYDSSVESSDHDNQERAKTKSKAADVSKQKVISIFRSLARWLYTYLM